MTGRYSRSLWSVAAVPAIAAIAAGLFVPGPHGHWSAHVSSAAMKAAQLVVLLILVVMLGWSRLRLLLLIALAVIAVGIVVQVLGDFQVAHSIWRTSGNPGFGNGYVEGHDRGFGDLLVLAGGLAFAVTAGVRRSVPLWLAILGAVMSVIPPPFLWPAAGALVLVLYGLTSSVGWADRRPPKSPGVLA